MTGLLCNSSTLLFALSPGPVAALHPQQVALIPLHIHTQGSQVGVRGRVKRLQAAAVTVAAVLLTRCCC
jgi:hypothetical protein